MRHRITTVVLDSASAITLGAGIAILLVPIVLHLSLGADDDSYLMIVEYGRDPIILLDVGLEWMYRPGFLLWPGSLIAIGLALKWLAWHWSPWVPSQSPGG
jgi:hypothetical protein